MFPKFFFSCCSKPQLPSPISYLQSPTAAAVPPASSLQPTSLIVTVTLFLFFLTLSSALAEPSVETLLQEARLHPTAHPITLSAQIRGAEHPLPLVLKIEKNQIEYQLHHPEESIILKLGSTTSSLCEKIDGKIQRMDDKKRYQEIRNTGVTYDDLSLGFLYWPHPRLLGTVTLRGQKSSLIELTTELDQKNLNNPYRSVHLWIDQCNGAPLRMEGFNQQNQLIKRFEIVSAQKIDDLWMLKEMRIESFDPETQKVIQRRYLEIARK